MPRSPSRPLPEVNAVGTSLLAEAPGIFRCYIWNNISFVVWTGPADHDSLVVFETLCRQCRARYPQGMSSVHLILPKQSQLPDAAARDVLNRLNQEFADLVVAMPVVIRGGGFWASAVRSLVTALRVLGPRTYELRIHSRVEEVVEWLPAVHQLRTGVAIAPQELLHVLQYVDSLE